MMVSTTAGGRPLKCATSRPGATHGGSIDLDVGAIWCRASERGGPSSEECAREVLSRGKWVWETRSGWVNGAQPAGPATRPPWACIVSVRVGSLGETHTCVRPEASCVPVRLCRGGPRSGKVQLAVGGLGGSKQVYLSFPESTPDQPDRLGMESPLSGECELSWERVGCTIELPRDVNSAQRLELRVTPEEEMAGELWNAVWSPFPEPRGCLPIACSAPARAGGICCDNSMPGHLF